MRTLSLFLVVSLCGAAAHARAWTIETVDADGIVGHSPTLAFDPAGSPAVVYRRFDSPMSIKLARHDGTDWRIETLATDTGFFSDLAFDPADHIAVGFDDSATGLQLSRHDGIGWATEVIDPCSCAVMRALAFDPFGSPIIAYLFSRQDDSDLMLARHDGAAWSLEVVDADGDTGYSAVMALDAAGHPVVGYAERLRDRIRVARYDGAVWTLETVDSDGDLGWGEMSIALDSAGNPALSYWELKADALRVARHDGRAWACETIDPSADEGQHSSLAYDAGDRLWLAYRDETAQVLKLAVDDGNGWATQVVDTSYGAGNGVSVAFDPGGNPAIAYFDFASFDLKYASSTAVPPTLYRGVVADLAPGWKPAALPLDDGNDDPTPPFPLDATLPGSAVDSAPPASPLVLYRVLTGAGLDAGNVLRTHADGGGVTLSF